MKIELVTAVENIKQRKVVLSLSREALIGLGCATIRLCDGLPECYDIRTEPLGYSCANRPMGFYLTPNSPEIFFYNKELGDLNTNKIKINKEILPNIKGWKRNKGKLLVDMEFDYDFYECYNIGSKNVGEIRVYEYGEKITNKCYVIFNLSKSAFLGMGITMIRIANNYKEGDSYIINPQGLETQNNGLGLYLTNDSPEFEIICKTFEDALFYDPNIYI